MKKWKCLLLAMLLAAMAIVSVGCKKDPSDEAQASHGGSEATEEKQPGQTLQGMDESVLMPEVGIF